MIPYGKQSIDKKDIKAVAMTTASPFLTQGSKVAEFENALAKYCGVKYAVAVSNGTAALHIAYLVAGLKIGNEAITTPNTFVATTNMLLAVGTKPVFCDIRNDTLNIDETKIEKLITEKTKAIIPVHFAGHPCEMDKIMEIAKRRKLIVIEDACHALGAEYKKRKIGGISDMTVFSFHPVKSITTGEGGAVLTNSEIFYKKLLSLRSHGIHKDENGFNVMTEMGYNYRLTDIQAALGVSQIKKLDKFVKTRHKIVAWYKKYFADNQNIILPEEKPKNYSAWHLYVIRLKNKKDRMPLFNFLKENGIGVNFHYPPVYSHPYYRQNGFKNIVCSSADLYGETAISLPIFPDLSVKNVAFVAKTINNFFKKNG
ncbi:MAG: UDP-4-amino-4,6-dideoxy-N-acetyl-beta-L-altrosamine transaminase [Candidatus Paceibacterota bacterium]|jgi:UDP-4-amino-4,6-dideoxy-N-acetyl-beta-L-altrosamine transaminase